VVTKKTTENMAFREEEKIKVRKYTPCFYMHVNVSQHMHVSMPESKINISQPSTFEPTKHSSPIPKPLRGGERTICTYAKFTESFLVLFDGYQLLLCGRAGMDIVYQAM
jgi:hypothetical protein